MTDDQTLPKSVVIEPFYPQTTIERVRATLSQGLASELLLAKYTMNDRSNESKGESEIANHSLLY